MMPRSATAVRPPPFTQRELIAMRVQGDSVHQIFARAHFRDPALTIGALREILFGARY